MVNNRERLLVTPCLLTRMYTGIYPHLASQYHAWPSAARGIAMLSVCVCVCVCVCVWGSDRGVAGDTKNMNFGQGYP